MLNEVEDFFNSIECREAEKLNYDDNGLVSLYDIFKLARHNENPELATLFNQAIKMNFDGIVLDANDADKSWNFKNLERNTRHYIVFDENNVKSAIGNNGEYSLYDNNMCARRSEQQHNDIKTESLKGLVENITNYKEKYNAIVGLHFDAPKLTFRNKNFDQT